MKISRDPNFEHVANGGIYIGNIIQTAIFLDGTRVDSWDIIEADSDEGYLLVMQRSENGFPITETKEYEKPVTKRVEGQVVINWPEQDCVGCAEASRKRKQKKNWWLM